jgi:hypothetical protein
MNLVIPSEQVVIGKLKDPKTIKGAMTARTVQEWDHRAMWSWARLQFGRSIDQRIKDHFDMIETMKNAKLSKEERKAEMELLFADFVAEVKTPRKLQFIFSEEQRVMAVASLKHLLIPPAEVYDMAKRILGKNYGQPKLIGVRELNGLAYQVKQEAGFQLGLQIFGGSITTRQAITLTSWLRVELCLNPLSWLGIGSFGSLGIGGSGFERILRIKVKADLEPRLRGAIEQSLGNMGAIEGRVSKAEKAKLQEEEARIIASALGLRYSLGAKTISQVLERYEKEPKSLWGLSMASSWVAAHGKFKKTPNKHERQVEQKLSTIAGAAILIDDIKAAKQKSLDWLKSHVVKGKVKSLDELLEDVL